MESMQGAGAGARQGARDIVVPRATCTAPSRRRKMSFFFLSSFFGLLLAFLDPRCRIFFFFSNSSSSPRAWASPRAPRQRGCAAINASARLHPALPRSAAIPDSFFVRNFPFPCAWISGPARARVYGFGQSMACAAEEVALSLLL